MPSPPVPVLYFHSVAPSPDPGWSKSYLTVTTRLFENLLKYLSRRGFSFVTLAGAVAGEGDPGRRKVCLTFDDGYLDNFVFAFPILKRYGARATVFVSPEYVDASSVVRPNLEDLWNGRCTRSDLPRSGFLSWREMEVMEASGLVRVESHGLTHSKVYRDTAIRDFHHPGADCLNPIGNRFPLRKPYYMKDPGFERLLPFGTPFFREASALVTREVRINPDFSDECVARLATTDWTNYSFRECMATAAPLLARYGSEGSLVAGVETPGQYRARVLYELSGSRDLIQRHLNKEVEAICWPNGDYNQYCVDAAFKSGYRFVHAVPGKGPVTGQSFVRTGVSENSMLSSLSFLRTVFRLNARRGAFPFSGIDRLYRLFRRR